MKISNNYKSISFLALLAFFFLLGGGTVFAAYDLYVDEDASGSKEEGTKDEPFRNIEDALDEASSGDEIYIKDGEYEGDFVVGKSVKLTGEAESEVIISGPITMKDKSSLKDLTVSGGRNAITVEEDSSVEIDNCSIKKFGKIGIVISAGNGKLEITDSKIYGGDGKGLYIEKGNRLELSNTEVYENDEEGVDVRSGVDGFIKNNYIQRNGESGIEIILGSSEVVISGNSLQKNGSSGISTQFYPDHSKLGSLNIVGNKIKDNDKYGIDCGAPHGGKIPANYWTNSVKFSGNDFEENDLGRFAFDCQFKKEEKNDDTQEDVQQAVSDSDQEEIARQEAERKELEKQEKIKVASGKLEVLDAQYQETVSKIEKEKNLLEKRGKMKLFFFGTTKKDLLGLSQLQVEIKKHLESLDDIESLEWSSELQEGIDQKRKEIRGGQERIKDVREIELEKTGIFGWFKNIFNN